MKPSICATLFILLAFTPGCGQQSMTQIVTIDGVHVSASLAPSPPLSLQQEGLSLAFSDAAGSHLDVQSVQTSMAMSQMQMKDRILLSRLSKGAFQASYQFAMAGDWIEAIRFRWKGHMDTMQLRWHVSE